MHIDRPRQTLRLLSINTWKCEGAYEQRLETLALQTADLNPDVLICQEVFQSEDLRYDTARFLAERLDIPYRYVPFRYKKRNLQGQPIMSYSGLALLSRWHIDYERYIFLPDNPHDPDRRAQLAVLARGNRRVLIANTHLTHLPNASALRIAQLETILRHPLFKSAYNAVLICGDLNAETHGPEFMWLGQPEGACIIDAYQAGTGAMPGYTFPADAVTAKGQPKAKRIDYILAVVPLGHPHPDFKNASVAFTAQAHNGITVSDHFGVYVEMEIPQG